MGQGHLCTEINKRIAEAFENQHKSRVGQLEYEYWKGAHDALIALLEEIYEKKRFYDSL